MNDQSIAKQQRSSVYCDTKWKHFRREIGKVRQMFYSQQTDDDWQTDYDKTGDEQTDNNEKVSVVVAKLLSNQPKKVLQSCHIKSLCDFSS